MKYSGVTDIEMREVLFDNNDSASEDEESPAVQWTWQREVLDEEWLDIVKVIVTLTFLEQCKKTPNASRGLSKRCK